jgi:two-component system, NtrC family, C4-dicarboxylate transport sensor histidine kinase DctB
MRDRRSLALLSALVLVAAGVALWQTGYWARSFVMSDIRERSGDILNLVVENLRGELAKFQYQPRLLAFDPAFERALSNDASQADVTGANEQLVRFNDISGAAATFLLDRSGRTVAASDWQSENSFLGRSFSFRPYFHAAMQGSLGRDFAVEPDTGERSYYFAHPIRVQSKIVGAVVIKIAIDRLEPSWLSSDQKILVVDGDGVVFLSTHPDWRFRSLAPLSTPARNRLILSRRYGARDIPSLPVTERQQNDLVSIRDTPWTNDRIRNNGPTTTYLTQSREMNEAGWRVLILSDTRSVTRQANTWSAIVAFMMVSVLLLAANIYQRRRRYAERMALQETVKEQLEVQVAQRTTDLTEANTQLRSEIAERHKTETQLRQTQAELVQATKLAALGQISAGLSHELNQPLAAIRSYSDNARTYLDRDQVEPARSNLKGISELTARMGRIIKNLRTYAREEPAMLRPISVTEAVTEALGLLDARIKSEKVSVSAVLPDIDPIVMGGAVRLQQVLVNLISNALDAMQHSPTKDLHLSVETGGENVTITVHDSGPGIVDDEIDKLFDPFFSTKEVGEGMGLGLSITFGIIKQFGGEIAAENHPDGGAVFTVKLSRAETASEAAE